MDQTPAAAASAALFERARAVMPSGYTRNTIVAEPHPFFAAHAYGCRITDADGATRIDWLNNYASLVHGHNHPAIVVTLVAQLRTLACATMPTAAEVELAELLVARIGSVEELRYTASGTEANLMAIKAARAHTGRSRVAKFEGGYHGQYDLLEASYLPGPPGWGDASRPRPVAHNAGTPRSLLDELVLLPINDVDATRAILRDEGGALAAVIVDPFGLSLGSPVPADRAYLAMLREETARLGIVLVFDEVWSLRLGYGGMQGELGIAPDLTTMGKMIGGGLPIGAIGGRRDVMSVFALESGPKVRHSGTFVGNPLSTAAGAAAMRLLTREAIDMLAERGARLKAGLERCLADARVEATVLHKGSMTNVVYAAAPPRSYRELVAYQTPERRAFFARLQSAMERSGLHVQRNMFIGSTAMADGDIDETVDAFARALREAVAS